MIYDIFIKNVKGCQPYDGPVKKGPSGIDGRFELYRSTSFNVLPTLPNQYFDIIFISVNTHNPEYAIEEAVLSFRKLKTNGYLIFDACYDENIGIKSFLDCYKAYIKIIGIQVGESQLYLQKIKDH